MARNLSYNMKRVVAGLCALTLVAGAVPVQPVAELFGGTGITAYADGEDITSNIDIRVSDSCEDVDSTVSNFLKDEYTVKEGVTVTFYCGKWWTNPVTIYLNGTAVATWAGSADYSSTYVWTAKMNAKLNWAGYSEDSANIYLTETESVAVTGVSLDKTTAQTITVGENVAFTASISPDNTTDKTVKWSTSNANVKLYSDEACTTEVGTDATSTLTVYAKGISAGSATVTAASNADATKTASCDVTVSLAAAAPTYAVTAAEDLTYDGEEKTLAAVTGEGGAIHYKLSTDTAWSDTIPTATDAGEYTLQWYSEETDTYAASGSADEPNTVTCSIAKADPVNEWDGGTVQGDLTVADGTDNNSYVPIYGFYADAYLKCQYIIPASLLADMEGCDLSAMTLYLKSTAGAQWGCNWQVYLTETDATTISNFQDYSGHTMVYEGTLDGTQDTMDVTFGTAYTYGGGNLLVTFVSTTKENYSSASFYGVGATGACVQGYNYTNINGISPTGQNFIPKTTFTYEGAATPAIRGLAYTGDPQELCNEITGAGTTYYKLSTDTQWSTNVPTATNAGDYTVQWYITETTNYNAIGSAENPNSFTASIAKVDVELTGEIEYPDNDSVYYNGVERDLVKTAPTTGDGIVEYALGTGEQLSWSTNIPTATAVGIYTVWYRVTGDNNHNDIAAVSHTVEIKEGHPFLTIGAEDYAVADSQGNALTEGDNGFELNVGGTYTVYSNQELTAAPTNVDGLNIMSGNGSYEFGGNTYKYKAIVTVTDSALTAEGEPNEYVLAHTHSYTSAYEKASENSETNDILAIDCISESVTKTWELVQLLPQAVFYYGEQPTADSVQVSDTLPDGVSVDSANIGIKVAKADNENTQLDAFDGLGSYIVNATIPITVNDKSATYTLKKGVEFQARPMDMCDFYLVDGETETKLTVKDGVVTVPEHTFTYTGEGQAPTIKVVNPANDEVLAETDYTDAIADVEAVNAGDYTADLTAAADGNYDDKVTVAWTIDQADADLSAAPVCNTRVAEGEGDNDAIVYDGAALEPSDFEFDGEQAELAVEDNITIAFGKTDGKTAGKHTATITVTDPDGNYKDAVLTVPVTIARRQVTITPEADQSEQYGEAKAPVLTYTVEEEDDENNTGFIASDAGEGTANEFFGDLLTLEDFDYVDFTKNTPDDYAIVLREDVPGTGEESRIGHFVNDGYTTDYLPVYRAKAYGYNVCIYTSQEVGALNQISSLSWMIHSLNDGQMNNKFSIYLVDTDDYYFGGEGATAGDFDVSGLTPVYTTPDEGYSFTEGLNTFAFNSAFTHDPDKNLAVIVVNTTGASGYYLTAGNSYLGDGVYRSARDFSDTEVVTPNDSQYNYSTFRAAIVFSSPAGFKNYELVLPEGEDFTFTVEQREITADMITVTESNYDFDGTAHTVAVSVGYTVKDAAGEDVTRTLTEGTDFTVSGTTKQTKVGGYNVYVTGLGNYTGRRIAGFWSIDSIDMTAALTVTDVDETNTVTYTGKTFGTELTVSDVNGDVENFEAEYTYYKVEGDNETKLEGAPVDVGDYRVEAAVTADNHNNTTCSASFTIAPATLTAAIADESTLNVSYGYAEGEDEFAVTLTGFVNDEEFTATAKAKAVDDEQGQHADVGTYDVSFSDVADEIASVFGGNYVLTEGDYSFTVGKMSLAGATVKVKKSFLSNADEDGFVTPEVEVIDSYGNTVPADQYEITGSNETNIAETYDIYVKALDSGNYTDEAQGIWVVEDGAPVVMTGRYLDLSGKIKLNVQYAVPDALTEDEGAKVIITSADGTVTEKLISELPKTTSGGKTICTVSMPVLSPEMADRFNYKFVDGKGEPVELMDKDGYTEYAEGYDFSAADYLDLALTTPGIPESFLGLAEATKNYGTAAQIFFGHGDIEGLTVSDDVKNVTAEDIKDYALTEEGDLPSIISDVKMSLSLNDDSSLTVIFNFKSAPTKAQLDSLTCTIDGKDAELVKKGSKSYALVVKNIAAPELDITHEFTVSDGTSTYTTRRSALSYAYAVAGLGGSLGDLGKALFLYNAAANDYFGV